MTAAPIALRPVFSFTHHATERFMARVWPSIGSGRACADGRKALAILCDAAARAEMLPRRTNMGHAVWQIADPAMRWITRPDTYRGRRVAVVVTVLGGADNVDAEEDAEREVLEAHRRLQAIPELGEPKPTSPPPGPAEADALKAYRAWVALETQRLAVERTRLKALAHAIASGKMKALDDRAAAEMRREYTRHIDGHSKRVKGLQQAIEMRNDLLLAMATRLAEIDPEGSAELLARADGLRGGPPPAPTSSDG